MASMTLRRIEEKLETSANFKQALSEATKKLQKKPKDPYHLYWKAAVCLKFGRDDEAFKQLEDLCASTPAITDPELLCAIYEKLSHRETTEKSRQLLWDNAYKATKSGYLLTAWFESAAMVNCWSDAQIALTKLRAYFPKEEKYVFALPAIEQLVADTHRPHDAKKQDLFSRLAYMKLAMAVKKAMKGEKASDTVTTSRELRLLVQIYQKQNREKDLLEILDSPNVGLFSPLVRCDQTFVRIKLEILEKLKMWRELWDFCATSLKGEHEVDERWKHYYLLWSGDFVLWRSLYLAYGELQAQEADIGPLDDQMKQIQQQHEGKFAREKYMGIVPSSARSNKPDHVLNQCNEYFAELAFRKSCFGDLRPYVEKLDRPQQLQFLDSCRKVAAKKADEVKEQESSGQKAWLQVEVNSLKFEYLLNVSTSEGASRERLEAFAINSIRLLSTSYTIDDPASEDTLVLAITALVRLYHVEPSQQHLVQALLLFRVWDDQCGRELSRKTNLLRVLLMTYMGLYAGSVAAMDTVKLKEILFETLGHYVWSRASISHPYAWGSGKDAKDPATELKRILRSNVSNQQKLNQFLGMDLETLQYDRILEIAELKQNLSKSLGARISAIERRRIYRIKGEPVDDEGRQFLDGELDDLHDSRDVERLQDFEHSECPRFEYYLATGPMPKRYWLAAFTLVDDTCNLIVSPESKRIPFENAERVVREATDSDRAELTQAESSSIDGWLKLRTAASTALLGTDIENIPTALQQLEAHLETMKAAFTTAKAAQQSSYVPLASLIRHMFLSLEFLQGLTRFIAAALKLSKTKTVKWAKSIPSKDLQHLQALTQDFFATVRQAALDWKNKLSEQSYQGIKAQAKAGEVGEVVLKEVAKNPDSVVDGLASMVLVGANESLDGVLRVKLA